MQDVILRRMQRIGKLSGAGARDLDEQRPAGSLPGQDDNPAAPGPNLSTDRSDSPTSGPPPIRRADPAPRPRKIERSVSDGLQETIMACAFPRRRVEAKMKELCETYRSSMPPCRLKMFAWEYPKGSPPRVIYWVRLFGRPDQFDHASLLPIRKKRPRWFKILKIRTRKDLHDAIYWNGLSKHRRTVMSFYDSWWALNKSHSILARGMKYATDALSRHLEASGPGDKAPLDLLMDPTLEHLGRAGEGLFIKAWQIGRLVEKTLSSLEELRKRTAPLPLRLVLSEGPTPFDRVMEWEHGVSGWRCRIFRKNFLQIRQLSPQDLAAVGLAVSEGRVLRKSLSKRLRIIRKTESRLAQARRDSDQALERYNPPERFSWAPGY